MSLGVLHWGAEDDKDWRNLGGTQLCVNEHMLPRPKAVASCSAAAAEAVAKEARKHVEPAAVCRFNTSSPNSEGSHAIS